MRRQHQTVNVTVDVYKQTLEVGPPCRWLCACPLTLLVQGFTELTLTPRKAGGQLPAVFALHARQLAVASVTVNGVAAPFTLVDAQAFLVPEGQRELRELSTLAAYRTKAFKVSQEEGELRVPVPRDCALPARLCVVFALAEPGGGGGGVFFRPPRGEEAAGHMYTQGRAGEACCVFPCLDVPWARCAFELTVAAEAGLVVVASGAPDPFPRAEGPLVARTFRTAPHCAARDLFFAVGPFVAHVDPRAPSWTHHCLPGSEEALRHTAGCFAEARTCLEKTVGLPPFPLPAFATLFLPDTLAASYAHHGGALFSDQLLFTPACIDEQMDSVFELVGPLGEQWAALYLQVDEWGETWIPQGVAQLLAHLFMRAHEHSNNARWRLLCLTEEFLEMPSEVVARPLYVRDPGHAADMFVPFVRKKALLILTMLHRRVNETQFKDALAALFAQPAVYSTRSFLERIADATKHVTDDIEKYWVQRGGFLSVACGFSWNQKRHYLEFALKQDYSVARFAGNLPVRVREIDGEFNHEIYFDDVKPYAWDDFPVHARPPQKKKKRAKKGEDEETAAAAGAASAAATPAAAPAAAATPAASGSKFNTSEITSDEKEVCPIMFLRVDPDAQWIAKVSFRQPFEMWINLLDTVRDVAAEREAVRALREFHTVASIERLAEILNDPDCFFRIRMEAAASLATLAGPDTDWRAGLVLAGYYRETHFAPGGATLRENDFSDFARYFVARAVLEALAGVAGRDGFSFAPGAAVVLEVLQHNDNSLNRFSDHLLLHSALQAAGRLVLRPGSPEAAALAAQLERYARNAELLPSFHAQLPVSVLQCRLARALAAPGPGAPAAELQHFRRLLAAVAQPAAIRVAAGEALLRLALLRGSPEDAERALEDALALVERPSEAPAVRLRVLEAAAAAARAQRRAAQWSGEGGARPWSAARLARLAERLWLLVAGPPLAACAALRAAAAALYAALWGLDTPPPLGPPPAHLLLAARLAAPQEAPTAALATQRDRRSLGDWRQAVGGQGPLVAALPPPPAPKPEPAKELPKEAPKPEPAAAPATKLKLVLKPPAAAVVTASAAPAAPAAEEPDAKKVKLEPAP